MKSKKQKKTELNDEMVDKKAELLQKEERDREKENRVAVISHRRTIMVIVTSIVSFCIVLGGVYMTAKFRKSDKYSDIDLINASSSSTSTYSFASTPGSSSSKSSSKSSSSVSATGSSVPSVDQAGVIRGSDYHPINSSEPKSEGSSHSSGIDFINNSKPSSSGGGTKSSTITELGGSESSTTYSSSTTHSSSASSTSRISGISSSYSDSPEPFMPPVKSSFDNNFTAPPDSLPPSDGTPFDIP